MISTNKVRPKPRTGGLLEELLDDHGELTGIITSAERRNVITTSQARASRKGAPALPTRFPRVRIVEQRKPAGGSFIQTSDLDGIRKRAANDRRMALLRAKEGAIRRARAPREAPEVLSTKPRARVKGKKG